MLSSPVCLAFPPVRCMLEDNTIPQHFPSKRIALRSRRGRQRVSPPHHKRVYEMTCDEHNSPSLHAHAIAIGIVGLGLEEAGRVGQFCLFLKNCG